MSEWIVKQNPDGQLEVVGELIRCKDCKYITHSNVFDRTTLYCYHHRDDDGDWEPLENDEGFCSWAVRKE